MRTYRLAWGALALAVLAGTAPLGAQTPAPADDPVVARRGAITLTASQVRDLIRFADPEQQRQFQTNPSALDRAVRDRMLLLSVLAEAHANQWDTRPDVVWRADQARDSSIGQSYIASLTAPDPSYPSEQELQAAYEANKARLMLPRQYHVAQIYLVVPAGAPAAADTAAQKRLADLRAQIAARRADFATLARKQSDDHASAANGGDLGWVREDQLVPPVRAAVAGLAEGAVSDPVRSGDGWHLIRLLGTRPAAPASLAEAHDALVRALRQQKQQDNARTWLAGLLKQEPIEINEIALSGLQAK